MKLSLEQEIEIVSLYTAGELPVIEIARIYGCSGPWVSTILKRHGVIVEGANKRRRSYARKNLYQFDAHAFDDLSNEAAAYWLGFIYADGHTNKKSTFIINLAKIDQSHLEKLNGFLKSEYKILESYGTTKGKRYARVSLHVTSQRFVARLKSLGVITGRSKLVDTLAHIPSENVHHFMRGIFDGDGCAVTSRPELVFCGKHDAMEWVRDTLASQIGTMANKKITTHRSGLRYLWYSGRPQTQRIAAWMYSGATIWLDRKRAIIDAY